MEADFGTLEQSVEIPFRKIPAEIVVAGRAVSFLHEIGGKSGGAIIGLRLGENLIEDDQLAKKEAEAVLRKDPDQVSVNG